MHPTLEVQDVLIVAPYRGEPILRGDVIVYKSARDDETVVHRVVHVCSGGGIKTQGDNNPRVDDWIVKAEHVVGRVDYAVRGGRQRRVHRGRLGHAIGYGQRLRNSLRRISYRILQPAYLRLARTGLMRRLAARMEIRVVRFHRSQGDELHLLWRNRDIGRLQPGDRRWQIRSPFRLIVDEEALPRDQGLGSLHDRKP